MPLALYLAQALAALRDVARSCSLPLDDLDRAEGVDRISRQYEADLQPLAAIDQAQLDGWFAILGGALTIRFTDHPGSDWGLASHARSSLDPILEAAKDFSQTSVGLHLEVRKEILGKQVGTLLAAAGSGIVPEAASLRIILFFCGARLTEILARPDCDYRFFEEEILSPAGAPAVDPRLLVLIADSPGRLAGTYLAVLGSDHLEDAAEFARAPVAMTGLQEARDIAASECVWDSRPHWLTPDFFRLDPETSPDVQAIRVELLRLQNALSIPYLANRSVATPGGGLLSTFEGKRALEVPAGAERRSDHLYELYRWTYEEAKSARTKLEIVRSVVAARFPAASIAAATLSESAPGLLSEAKIQLRILVDANVVESFDRRERIDKVVRDYVDTLSKQAQGLARELVDNAYKTAGLLFAVVIAYLLKPDQGILVLSLSVLFYVAYILFVRFFYLPSIENDQLAREDEYTRSTAEIQRYDLLTVELQERLASVHSEDRKLAAMYQKVSRIYVAMAVIPVVLLGGWLLVHTWRQSPAGWRAAALETQSRRFKAMGYRNVLLRLQGGIAPLLLVDPESRVSRTPDLTATRRDGLLLALAYVPCADIGKPGPLAELALLQDLAVKNKAELQLLTPSACGEDPGPERLRAWLSGKLSATAPPPKIWND